MERKHATYLIISLAGALLNFVLSYFIQNVLSIPMFLDTIFTITVTLVCGLFWGVLTGLLTNIMIHSVFFYGWHLYLYTFCNIAVALVTFLFIKWFPRELNLKHLNRGESKSQWLQNLMEKAVVLILLSFALSVVISVLGGLFSTIINYIQPPPPEAIAPELHFKFALIRKGFPLILTEIASRIPVNLLDRLVSCFVGYAAALGLQKTQNAPLLSN